MSTPHPVDPRPQASGAAPALVLVLGLLLFAVGTSVESGSSSSV